MMSETTGRTGRWYFYRHSVVVRITHWINVVCMTFLLMSGLQIFNAHPALYWGDKSDFEAPLLSMRSVPEADGTPAGVTRVFGRDFETTGVFGSSGEETRSANRGFPWAVTIPGYRDLAAGRRWHFFFAWLFVINGLVYVAHTILSGHWRNIVPTGGQLWHFGTTVKDHLFLRFPKGEEAKDYNVLQKVAYFAVIFILVPALILAGLTMSPGLNAAFPWLLDLFDGRQSARTVHFIVAALILGFVVIHLVMVVLSGLWNNIRSMITGRFRIESEETPHAAE